MTRITKLTSLLLLVVLCVGMLASCGIGSYEKKLTEAGYKVEVMTDEDIEEANEKTEDYEIKAALVANKDLINTVTVTKFASADQAEKFVDDMSLAGALLTIEVKGSVVIAGTEDAVNAALGK